MPPENNSDRNVFVALVGSRPLVVFIDNWTPGRIEAVTVDGEPVTNEGEPVTIVV